MIIAECAAATTAVPELDRLAEVALTRVAGDSDEQQATAKWHLAGYLAANNVSMMGGWT